MISKAGYEDNRDLKNSLDAAFAEGKEEGREQGREQGRLEGREQRELEIARALLKQGMSAAAVAEVTGLPEERINRISIC